LNRILSHADKPATFVPAAGGVNFSHTKQFDEWMTLRSGAVHSKAWIFYISKRRQKAVNQSRGGGHEPNDAAAGGPLDPQDWECQS
jgi:hypothetical protein